MKSYKVDELAESIINEYHLKIFGGIDNLVKEIYRIIQADEDLSKLGKLQKNPQTGHKATYYPETVKTSLLTNEKLLKYLNKSTEAENIIANLNYMDLQKNLEDAAAIEDEIVRDSIENSNEEFDIYVSDERFRQTKYEIMINAIFELFFTPFNDELLKEDLNRLVLTSDSTADMQDEIARQRILHPLGNYFEVLKWKTDKDGNGGFWKNDK